MTTLLTGFSVPSSFLYLLANSGIESSASDRHLPKCSKATGMGLWCCASWKSFFSLIVLFSFSFRLAAAPSVRAALATKVSAKAISNSIFYQVYNRTRRCRGCHPYCCICVVPLLYGAHVHACMRSSNTVCPYHTHVIASCMSVEFTPPVFTSIWGFSVASMGSRSHVS